MKPNKKLREELEKKTTEELYAELLKKDTRRAENIDKYNRLRLIRAIEIVASLGAVPVQVLPVLRFETEIYLLNPSREILRERVTKRLIKRLELGMIDEVKNLMNKGYTSGQMKKFGLEYKYIGEFLENTINEIEMCEKIVTKSMQYAKRQQTWNKKYQYSIAHF